MGLVDLLFGSKPKVFPVLRANSLVLLFVAVVLTFLQSCATQEASLEQRAKTWVELLGSRLARVRKRPERAKKIIGKSRVGCWKSLVSYGLRKLMCTEKESPRAR